MTEHDKYKTAQDVFGRILTELTDLPEKMFREALDKLEAWWGNLRQRDIAMPPVPAGNATEDEANDSQVPSTRLAEHANGNAEEEKDAVVHLWLRPLRKSHSTREQAALDAHKNRAVADTQRSKNRKEYNNGTKLRNALRGDDVLDVEQFLNDRRPPLIELSSFLNTFEIRFAGHKKNKITVAKRVLVVSHASFRLPQAMVKNALDQIDQAIPFGDPMDLIERPDPTEPCWIAEMEKVGEFTHRQLMAMHYIWAVITACDSGMKCYSWLMGTIDERLEGEGAATLANRLINSWPYEVLRGFSFDLVRSHLYCARGIRWYHDNLIGAFTTTLADSFKNNTTIFLPPLKTPADRKGDRISPTTISCCRLLPYCLCSCQ
ncbi:unnamed protein product [Phytophthora fragariaefolia]|uniref:Unnamed protein product n=1 Tax=Phytophthora fragariaefolia TaxID=1490495 RepID=A0A9W6XZP6_9STRA|nr:unnamed protein product [Phytophthora fragariaefolia]